MAFFASASEFAAVDVDGRCRNECSRFGCEERNGIGDLLRRSNASNRDIRASAARFVSDSSGSVIPVRIRPGATQLTVMPCGARSRAAARVKPTRPALDAA
jgi:hypothetical protein